MMLHEPVASRHVLTVTELTRLVRDRLEGEFLDVWIEGEVSNLRMPGSGHVYCTLKDEQCQLRAVLFRGTAQRLRFELEEGLAVTARGRVTVYEPRGEYQMILEYVEPKGLGALQFAFEQLKERLSREGLFDDSRKRPLPDFPWTVGVVTSLSGAALRDILSVLHRRCPTLNVLIAPVAVQGNHAAEQIAAAVTELSRHRKVDVMIVGRGGGPWEDLWCFNDERVVRAVAASRVPVVSAVGHETDVTLVDFAADYRAPTPSAAAEAVSPVLDDIVARLGQAWTRARGAMLTRCSLQDRRLESALRGLASVRLSVQQQLQRVDEASTALIAGLQRRIVQAQRGVLLRQRELTTQSPLVSLKQSLVLVPQLLKRLEQVMRTEVGRRLQLLHRRMTALETLSPLAILGRGYSIVRRMPDGQVLRNAADVDPGTLVEARLAVGRMLCVVKDTGSHRPVDLLQNPGNNATATGGWCRRTCGGGQI